MRSLTKSPARFAWTAASLLALAALAFAPASARADFQFTTVAASDSDGSLSAEAYFTVQTGQITVYLANLTSGTQSQGQAVSALSFTVNGVVDTALSLKSVSGTEATLSGGTFTTTPYQTFTASGSPAEAANWEYANNGGNVYQQDKTLTYVLNSFNPNHPVHMIVGPNASHNGNGGTNFNPYFQSTATTAEDLATAPQGSSVVFVLTDPNITTASIIGGVEVFFGTGADAEVATTGGPTGGPTGSPTGVVPAPPSIVFVVTAAICLGGFAALPRRRKTVAA